MPKIKLIKVHGVKCDYCDCHLPVDEMSHWQEITEEELRLLQFWQTRGETAKENVAIVILEEITSKETVDGFISDIKNFIKDQEIQEQNRKKKEEERIEKKKLLAKQKKIERAKQVLQENGVQVD